jgi:hypothetical protein
MFICNLSEVAEIQHYEAPFYDATDCFDLTHHAGYHKRFVIRRGAERSQKAMRAWAERELKAAIDHADAANRNIDWKRERLAQINAGNLR